MGGPALVIEVLLCLHPRSRVFLLPVILGTIAGLIAVALQMPEPHFQMFLAVFAVVAIPIGIICGIVVLIDVWQRPKKQHAA